MIESGQHGLFNIESDDIRKRHLNIDTDGGSMPGVNIIKLLFSMTLRQKKSNALFPILFLTLTRCQP